MSMEFEVRLLRYAGRTVSCESSAVEKVKKAESRAMRMKFLLKCFSICLAYSGKSMVMVSKFRAAIVVYCPFIKKDNAFEASSLIFTAGYFSILNRSQLIFSILLLRLILRGEHQTACEILQTLLLFVVEYLRFLPSASHRQPAFDGYWR